MQKEVAMDVPELLVLLSYPPGSMLGVVEVVYKGKFGESDNLFSSSQ